MKIYKMKIKKSTNTLIRSFDHGIKTNIDVCKASKEEKLGSISNLHEM